MKIEQYKSDVKTLVLSDSFKQSLKEKMAKEYSVVATEATPKPWMKYSKYIATAACLMLIVATIGVVSLMGGNFSVEKSADNAMESTAAEDTLFTADGMKSEEFDDMPTAEEVVTEEAVLDEETAAEEEEYDDDAIIEEDEEVEEVEEAVVEEAPAAIEETAEVTSSNGSAYAPEDYDGEYYAEDYILGNNTSPEYEAQDVVVSFSEPIEETYSEYVYSTVRHLDTVNFVRFTVLKAYSAEDAYALTGDESFETTRSLYKIELTYDYLNGVELDTKMYLSYPGTVDVQIEGRPILSEGEKYLTCLTFDGDYAEMLYEMSYAIHRINGLDVAYHLVGGDEIDPGYTHMGMLDIEREVITTTLNNPAQYTHKAAVKELTRYIKRKWAREDYTLTEFIPASEGDETSDESFVEDLPIISGEHVSELGLELDSDKVTISFNGSTFDPKSDGTAFYSELNSLSNGSGSSSESSYLSYIGGKITFGASSTFGGAINEISLSEGSTLPIKVNGVGIGDTMDALIKAFGIRHNVDGELTLTVTTANASGTAYTVTVTVTENVITEIVIK